LFPLPADGHVTALSVARESRPLGSRDLRRLQWRRRWQNFFALPLNLKIKEAAGFVWWQLNKKWVKEAARKQRQDRILKFYKKMGAPRSTDWNTMNDLVEEKASQIANPKDRLKLKDEWWRVSNYEISEMMAAWESGELELPSEKDPKYWRAEGRKRGWSDEVIEEKVNQVIEDNKRLKSWFRGGRMLTRYSKSVEGGIIQSPSAKRVRTCSSYLLPLVALGLFVPKLAGPSMALSAILTAGLISGRGAPPVKRDSRGRIGEIRGPNPTTIILTLSLMIFHALVGASIATLVVRFATLPEFLLPDCLTAGFVNTMLYLAALYYKTYVPRK